MYEIKDENLSVAVQAVLAAKKGSFLEAQSYENQMTVAYTDDQWQVAHILLTRLREVRLKCTYY